VTEPSPGVCRHKWIRTKNGNLRKQPSHKYNTLSCRINPRKTPYLLYNQQANMNRDSSWDNLVQDSLATGANGSNDATAANPHGMLGWRPVTATTTISNSDLANQKSHPSTTGQRNGSISSVNGPVKPPRRTSHPLQVEAVMQAEKDLTSPASPLQIPVLKMSIEKIHPENYHIII
jgi:hypothetical protein